MNGYDVGAFAAVAQVEVGGHGAVHAAVGKVLEVTALMRDLDALRQIEIGDFVDFDGDDLFGHPALIPGVALELANGLLGILAPQISGEREDVEAWFAGAGAVEAIAEACFGIQIDLPVGAAAARARFDVELLAGRAEGALVFNPFILKEQLWIDVFQDLGEIVFCLVSHGVQCSAVRGFRPYFVISSISRRTARPISIGQD